MSTFAPKLCMYVKRLFSRRARLAVVVVGHPLEQRTAEALGDCAPNLAVDDRRVDDRPAVLDRDHPLDVRLSRSRIDLDDRHNAAVRVSRLRVVEARDGEL